MLDQLARHALFDLETRATGDLHVDDHHTVEDIGIALGRALAEALGDKRGIRRYGSCHLAMDEALVRAALDLSGRPFLVWKVDFPSPKIGSFDVELVREFFTALAMNAGMTLNVALLDGANSHHIAEASVQGGRAGAARRRRARPARRGCDPLDQGHAVGMSTVIVDYASGNLHSALKSFQRMADETGAGPVVVSADPEAVRAADRIVLPGVGAFADCRAGLAAIPGLFEAIEARVIGAGRAVPRHLRRPADDGEPRPRARRDTPGFGWIPGEVVRIAPADPGLKVPHMGWNALEIATPHPVLAGIAVGRPRLFRALLPPRPARRRRSASPPSTTAGRSPRWSPATTSSARSSTRRRARRPACA